MGKKFFSRKPIKAHFASLEEGEQHLHRRLSSFQLTSIGIGAIIGAGIFVITGKAAAEYAGPAIVLSFILAALICAFAGLCYAELSAMIPVSGGSYSYAYVALGELPAWTIGWSVTAQYLFSASTVAAGWSGYLKSFLKDFGIPPSPHFSMAPFDYSVANGWSATGSLIDLPAVLLILAIGTLICIGIRAAAHVTSAMVFIKLATIALFIVIGIPHINPENFSPFIPENEGIFGAFGISGIIRGAGLVFFAYIGFDTVATLAQEAKKPQTDLPRGILGSLSICTVAYIVVALVLTGVAGYKLLDVPDPIAVALDAMGPSYFWVSTLVKIAILAGLASVSLVQILGQSRLFLAISQDGLLPRPFARIHHKLKTPLTGTVITTLATALLAGLFPVDILSQLVSMSTLLIFAIVCLTVLILRKTHPTQHRPFKVPLVPYIPLLGIITCLLQMLALPAITWMQLFLWLGLGFTIYFLYGARHSRLRNN